MALDFIDKLAALLADTNAPWVNRRDAADSLTSAIQRAKQALTDQMDDKDVDVKMAVNRALERLSAGGVVSVPVTAAPAPPPPPVAAPPTLDELVHACAKPNERVVEADGDGFRVQVTHKSGRHQTVHIERIERDDGVKVVRVHSPCGGVKDNLYVWSLKANARLVQSVIGIIPLDGQDTFCLMRTFLDGQITKPEMHAAIKEVAYYADWIEHKMTGQDVL